MTQLLIAELFQVTVPTVNEHLKGVFEDGGVETERTIRKFRIVRMEGNRQVSREIEHSSLAAILAVGNRVRSPRGTQFRQWAASRLTEYLVKGFKSVAASKSSWRIGKLSWMYFFASMIGAFCHRIPG